MTENTDEAQASGAFDYPQHRDGAELIGVTNSGMPVYYEPAGHRRLVADENPSVTEWVEQEDLTPDVSVSEMVGEIEQTVGWDSMTDYAREHIPGVGSDDDN